MYNYFMLVGRICNDIEIKEVKDGKRVCNLRIAVNKEFKNVDGSISTDFFNVSLWEALAEVAKDYFKKGIMVGIKGRILPKKEEIQSGLFINVNDLIGDRIVFFDNHSLSRDDTVTTESEG